MLLPRSPKRPNERRILTFDLDEKPGNPQHRICQQSFEAAVLLLDHLQPARLRHVHAAVLGLPRIQRCTANSMLAAHIGGLHPALLLARHRDDLLLAEPGLLHVRLLTKPDSSSDWQSFRRARHLRPRDNPQSYTVRVNLSPAEKARYLPRSVGAGSDRGTNAAKSGGVQANG